MELNAFMEDYRRNHQDPYQPSSGERLVKAQEYAEKMGLSVITVRERLKRGMISGEKIGKYWYVKVKDASRAEDSELIKELRNRILVLETQLKNIHSISNLAVRDIAGKENIS